MKEIYTVQETITPDRAWELLCQGAVKRPATFKEVLDYVKKHCFNRVISQNTVRAYADVMRRGEWMENGENIVIDESGVVIGGHHRLLAVVLAGVSIKIGVCRNVEREAYKTLNQGLAETLGSSLSRTATRNYNTVASIIAVNQTLERTGRCWANNSTVGGGRRRNNTEGHRLYNLDPSGYDKVAEDALRLHRNAPTIQPSWLGGIIYYLTNSGGYSYDYVLRFFKDVCSYETSTIQPANVLRIRLQKASAKSTKLSPSATFAFIVKAWNVYVQGKKIGILKYDAEREPFPSFVLNK